MIKDYVQIVTASRVIVDGDNGKQTLLSYLLTLLRTMWKEGQNFNGKRPFGNGSWQFDIYEALVKAHLVEGEFDKDGDLVNFNETQADELVDAVIGHLVLPL